MQIKEKIKQEIVNLFKFQKIDILIDDLENPPSSEMGDLSLPCFKMAKTLKKSPNDIAQLLVERLKPTGLIAEIKNQGPYVNFIFNSDEVAELVIKEISKQKDKYGANKLGKGQKIMIEYSQPNTHKEFHVGHLRNVCLGSSLINIYKKSGYKVIAANYVGDSGMHIAKSLWYLMNYAKDDEIPDNKGEYLGKIYVKAGQKLREDPKYKEEVSQVYQKFENQDPETIKLWQETKKWSMDQFNEVYKELNVNFDVWYSESGEEKDGKAMVPKLLETDFIKESEGAIIADLEKYDLGVLVLIRKDGTALYGIKDIALAKKKFKDYKLDKSIYVMDNRQSQYLMQIFKILELLGFDKIMIHVPYEFVGPKEGGAFASREGNVITYEQVKKIALKKVSKETQTRHSDWDEQKVTEVSLKIVLGALKFVMLKSNNNKVIRFDIDEAIDVNGFTGPYLQYTIARINSVLKKIDKIEKKINYSVLKDLSEKKLISDLVNYPQVIENVLEINDPSLMIQYVYNLAQDFNTFYHQQQILKSEPELKNARLVLIKAVKQVLDNGLNLLGIPILDEM